MASHVKNLTNRTHSRQSILARFWRKSMFFPVAESLFFTTAWRYFCSEEEGSYKSCRRICDELDVPMHGSADYHIIRDVCYAVSNRSAAIVAAGWFWRVLFSLSLLEIWAENNDPLACRRTIFFSVVMWWWTIPAISALLRHLDVSKVKIGVGGALIQFHPIYHKLLHDKLADLAPLSTEVWFVFTAFCVFAFFQWDTTFLCVFNNIIILISSLYHFFFEKYICGSLVLHSTHRRHDKF